MSGQSLSGSWLTSSQSMRKDMPSSRLSQAYMTMMATSMHVTAQSQLAS